MCSVVNMFAVSKMLMTTAVNTESALHLQMDVPYCITFGITLIYNLYVLQNLR